MFTKIKQFIIERIKWQKAGSPYRSDSEIKRIFDICQSNICERYQKGTETEGNCGVCGCRLTQNKEYLSKNSWATTNCPLGTPLWVEETSVSNIEVTEEEIQAERKDDVKPAAAPTNNLPPPIQRRGCGCGG